MTPDGRGRFCAHCQKTVIDFTTWSDAAIYRFLEKQCDEVCGRLHTSQMNRPLAIPYQPHSRLYRLAAALGLTVIVAGGATQAFAQSRPPLVSVDTAFRKPATVSAPPTGIFQGRVLDEHKEPVINATVQVYRNGVLMGEAVTDYDGKFSIKPLENGIYDAVIKFLGYDSVSIKDIRIIDSPSQSTDYVMKPLLIRHPDIREIHQGVMVRPLVPRIIDEKKSK